MDDKKRLICTECGAIAVTSANLETCPLCEGRLRDWEGYRRASGQGPRRPTPADAGDQLERDIQEYLRGVGDADAGDQLERDIQEYLRGVGDAEKAPHRTTTEARMGKYDESCGCPACLEAKGAEEAARREAKADELDRPLFKAGPKARRAIDQMFDALREVERTKGIEVAMYRVALGIFEVAVQAKSLEGLMAMMLLTAEALRRFAAEGGE